ncbi:MAG: hypothetical protein ACRD8W_31500 [Nitrososphaeraceae archaeon]
MKDQEPNAGWKQRDEYYLRKTDPGEAPSITIIAIAAQSTVRLLLIMVVQSCSLIRSAS